MTPAQAAGAVLDPELPVVTIAELGILRGVEESPEGRVTVRITPTYSGCPALDAIRRDVEAAVRRAGYRDVEVRTELSPPWSTDLISDSGKAKLAAAGIAPPGPARPVPLELSVRCPRCGSPDTQRLAAFGPTACTALWRCRACREPFERVKEL